MSSTEYTCLNRPWLVSEFLTNSDLLDDAIEGHGDSSHAIVDSGHYKAFVEVIKAAQKREPLQVEKIRNWEKLMRDVHSSESPSEVTLSQLVDKINERLKELWGKPKNSVEIVDLMAETLCGMEAMHMNGRISRLLVNYINSSFKDPVIIFRQEEKDRYDEAIRNPLRAKLFLADKKTEMIYGPSGEVMKRIGEPKYSEATYTYQNLDDTDERIRVEWHHLVKAQKQWSKEAGTPDS